MQNPDMYIDICKKSCNVIIPHCNIKRSNEEDIDRYNYFIEVFQYKFGRKPYMIPTTDNTKKCIGEDIQKILFDYRDVNLRIMNNKMVIEKIKEKMKIIEMEEERIRRKKLKEEVRKHVGDEFDSSLYKYLYIEGYENHFLRNDELKRYVNNIIKNSRSDDGKC